MHMCTCIYRFFPDFFPSPYTDRRQNLMRMYQAVEIAMPTDKDSARSGLSANGVYVCVCA